ncbi:Sec-independent protein translocase protein TatB [Zavarzinia sp.]|uniref:Sec-independent protein translocase protein TatB n=1 Tax=Zavarzinia sp. TaxID=2027920 RepID=UPI00356A8348
MFDLAWSEILLVGVVALVVVGPKDLPDLLRTVGRFVRKARMMASNFQSTFDQMMRDEEMAKTRQDLERAVTAEPTIAKPAAEPHLADEAEAAEAEHPAVPAPAPTAAEVAEAPKPETTKTETTKTEAGTGA